MGFFKKLGKLFKRNNSDSSTSTVQSTAYYHIPWFLKCLPCCVDSNQRVSITGSLVGTSDLYDDPTHPNLVRNNSDPEEKKESKESTERKEREKQTENNQRKKTHKRRKNRGVEGQSAENEQDPFEGCYVNMAEVDRLLRVSNVSESPYSSFVMTRAKSSRTERKRRVSRSSSSKVISGPKAMKAEKNIFKVQQQERKKIDCSQIQEKLEKELMKIHESRKSVDLGEGNGQSIDLNDAVGKQFKLSLGECSDALDLESEIQPNEVLNNEEDPSFEISENVGASINKSEQENHDKYTEEPSFIKDWMVW